jgi:hypothetical protein
MPVKGVEGLQSGQSLRLACSDFPQRMGWRERSEMGGRLQGAMI